MLELLFHPDTTEEIKSSFDWYQEQVKGLGYEFVQELDDAFNSIQSLPQTWPKMGQYHRRFILSRFPYSVIYKTIKTDFPEERVKTAYSKCMRIKEVTRK
ncbi:type II toxin-antitoxin system RelE/ParE family toxin [Ningiella sp. W23]|uniref:type II toxin-antitoxin system RelE/ParE family toxin n=1 Tax=Ningiella sp. W23 TaxID=3023715 RepID=UPI003756A465